MGIKIAFFYERNLMKKKLAIFIDWENLRQDIQNIQQLNKQFRTKFNFNNVEQVTQLIHKFVEVDEEIYRIFFYTAEPLDLQNKFIRTQHQWLDDYIQRNQGHYDTMVRINRQTKQFLKDISFKEYFALRLGELKLQGVNTSNDKLIITQKQVDMLLGLDISHIAYNKLVDRILVFSKDTDMIPSLKCARVNGLNVFIAHIKNGYKVADKLRLHSDGVRERELA